MKTIVTSRKLSHATRNNSTLAESHRRQFAGEDYQKVANDLLPSNFTDEDYDFLASAPDPGCDCGFCETADWH